MSLRLVFDELTHAAHSEDITVTINEIPATLVSSGLSVGEEIVVQQKVNGNYQDIVEDANVISLSTEDKNVTIYSPCVIRLYKLQTNQAVSVEMFCNEITAQQTMGATVYWDPSEITTLAWWDPSDSSTITESGGSVSQLDDRSGIGNHMKQGTGSRQPETLARTLNSLNVLDYDGSDFLEANNFAIPSGDVSFFMVAEVDSFGPTSSSLFCADAASHDFQLQAQASSPNFGGRISISNLGPANANLTGGPFNGPSIYNVNFDYNGAGIFNAFVDGTKRASDTTYSAAMNTSVSVKIAVNRGENYEINGGFGEFIICEDVTQATREKIEGYLAHKWGLTANLQSDHPYKTTRPTV